MFWLNAVYVTHIPDFDNEYRVFVNQSIKFTENILKKIQLGINKKAEKFSNFLDIKIGLYYCLKPNLNIQ